MYIFAYLIFIKQTVVVFYTFSLTLFASILTSISIEN